MGLVGSGEEATRLRARIELMSELGREFAEVTTDYQALLQLVTRRIGEVIGECSAVRMLDENGTLDVPGAIYSADPRIVDRLSSLTRERANVVGAGFSGRVLATGKSVVLNHVTDTELWPSLGPDVRDYIAQIRMTSLIVVPIRAHGKAIGTCMVYRSHQAPYTDEDRRFLEDIVGQAAIVIASSRLLEITRQRVHHTFLANMSHELRTPLNSIIGFSALLHGGKVGALTDIQHEFLGDILGSSRHLLQLINDVLDLSKIDSGGMNVRVEPVDLQKLVHEVRDIVRGLARERGIKLVIEVDATLGGVEVDPRMLKQVLYNYLSNALKFTSPDGRVTVFVRPLDESEFEVCVEDTGIGIAAEDLGRLFVEFQQLDQGLSRFSVVLPMRVRAPMTTALDATR